MNPVTSGTPQAYSAKGTTSSVMPIASENSSDLPAKAEPNKVTLSEEGKALLAALQQLDDSAKEESIQSKTTGSKVQAFTYGALGMDNPQEPKHPTDSSYTAGKYLSAAAKIGGMILLLA